LTEQQLPAIIKPMRKIMLVIDDFNDLLALEAFFRRIGFDVLSLGKDLLVNDALLGFVPDFVIATAKGRSVDGGKLAIRLAQQANQPRVALIYASGSPPRLPREARNAVDILIEIPFQPKILLAMVGDLLSLDSKSLVEKFEKQRNAKLQVLDDRQLFTDENGVQSGIRIVKGRGADNDELVRVFSTGIEGSQSAADRKASREDWEPLVKKDELGVATAGARTDQYAKFLDNNPDDVSGTLSHAALAAAAKAIQLTPEEKKHLAELDEKKREFIRALFTDSNSGPGSGPGDDEKPNALMSAPESGKTKT
jgi:hypothetical protein